MKTLTKSSLLLLALSAAPASSGTAAATATTDATEASVANADPADPVRSLEEIVVRGTREDRPASDLPVAVTVLDARALQDARVRGVRDLEAMAPSLSFNQLGQVGGTYLSIRGIESNPFIVNRAAIYVDGVPYRRLRAQDLGVLEQVEVLRGPQGSLYGANTEAGLVIIETRAPSEFTEAEASADAYGFDNGIGTRFSGTAGGPLGRGDLTGLVSASRVDADTFVRNRASSIDQPGALSEDYLQGRLRYAPDPSTRLDFIASMSQLRAPGVYEQEFVPMNRTAYDAAYRDSLNGGRSIRPWGLLHEAPKRTWERERVAAASLRRTLDRVRWENSMSWRDLRTDSRGTDLDLTALAAAAGGDRNEDRFLSLETRLLSPAGAALHWVLGLNLYEERSLQQLSTLAGPGGLDDYRFAPQQSGRGRDQAMFGQLGFPLGHAVRATAGLRLERATRTKQQDAGILDLGPVGRFGFDAEDLQDRFSVALPRLALDWRPTDWLLVYGSIARGWVPGGFNLQATAVSVERDFSRYGEETLWSREIGAKARFAGGRIQLAAALFDIEADRWQEYNVIVDAEGRALSTNLITADAAIRSRGGEIELSGRLSDGLDLSASLGWVDARYSRYDFSELQSFTGNRLKLVPEYDFALAIAWRPGNGFFLRGEFEATGPTPLTSANDISQGSVGLLGLQAGWETAHWEFRLYADNVFNRERFRSTGYSNFAFGEDGTRYAAIDTPRVVGLVFTRRWGA